MPDFLIVTDSAGDLNADLAQEMGVTVVPLSFIIGDEAYHDYPDRRDMELETFYERLKTDQATTNAPNVEDFETAIESGLQAGRDVLILAFSSALSSTYQSAYLAAQELGERYPERTIHCVDTLCASMGQGLLVYLASKLRDSGMGIDQVHAWVQAHKMNICSQFTVDDLHFLKRGGRISSATAVVGSVLSIKPVLCVNDEGKLINVGKARGRGASLKALVERMEQTVDHTIKQTVFISHSQCPEDAQLVADLVRERLHITDIKIGLIGPVIGAHTGQGTVALFYVGSARDPRAGR